MVGLVRGDRDALVAAIAASTDSAAAGAAAREVLMAGYEIRARIATALAGARWDPPDAVWHLTWAPLGRTRLEASLVGVTGEMLDARPFAGEWSIRQQLAHVELTYVRYSIATRYAARRGDGESLLPGADAYPARAGEPTGTPDEPARAIVERLRRTWDDAVAPLLDISNDCMQRPTEWHTAEHTVAFRLQRFSQHDLEMATDVRRTAAALGVVRTPSILSAMALVEDWGEVESLLLGVPEDVAGVLIDLVETLVDGDRQVLLRLRV